MDYLFAIPGYLPLETARLVEGTIAQDQKVKLRFPNLEQIDDQGNSTYQGANAWFAGLAEIYKVFGKPVPLPGELRRGEAVWHLEIDLLALDLGFVGEHEVNLVFQIKTISQEDAKK